MRKFYALAISAIVLLAIFISGCTKEEKPELATGSLSGRVDPARAAMSFSLFGPGATDSTIIVVDSTGYFRQENLKAGEYRIRPNAASGYTGPGLFTIYIKANDNTDLGIIPFQISANPLNPPPGVAYGSISGKISPAGASVSISVMNAGGVVRYIGSTDTSGKFMINNVTPASYVISFSPVISYTIPGNVQATVTAGTNTDIGTVNLSPVGKKAIDTIPGTFSFYTAQDAKLFLDRAANDSAIVLLGSFYVSEPALTPEMLIAMNKIIVCKVVFQIRSLSRANFTISGLKEAAMVSFTGSSALTTVSLPALTAVGTLEFRYCSSLTKINLNPSLKYSSLTAYDTGLTDLADFQSASFTGNTLQIQSNSKLTSLTGLNFASDSLSYCTITSNTLLTNLNGLQPVKRLVRETTISYNPVLQSLNGLNNAVYAKRFTMQNNIQLNTICPAKTLINYLKTAPTYQQNQINQITGRTVVVTIDPFTASANGNYATKDALIAAAAGCP